MADGPDMPTPSWPSIQRPSSWTSGGQSGMIGTEGAKTGPATVGEAMAHPSEPCPDCGRMMSHEIAVALGHCERVDCPSCHAARPEAGTVVPSSIDGKLYAYCHLCGGLLSKPAEVDTRWVHDSTEPDARYQLRLLRDAVSDGPADPRPHISRDRIDQLLAP